MATNGIVAGPVVEPARYGLLSVADVVLHTARDESWMAKMSWYPKVCSYDVKIVDICDPTGTIDVTDASGPDPAVTFGFAIDVTDVCTTMFGRNIADSEARIREATNVVTGKGVEAALWNGYGTGDTAYPSFANSTPTVLAGGTALDPIDAIAQLEENVDCGMGIRGTIHGTRYTISKLGMHLRVTDEELMTRLGTQVVAGTGYDFVGPDGQTTNTGEGWLYATGPIQVHLGPTILYSAFDVSLNDVYNKAERPAAIVWDRCCLFAVKVTL